ncbi:MAG: hypothetical protein PWP23_3330 [Candidatus Sumerlaeota bacterium]|nr:hypothetical protein [Candidatus Sumerlaeota bacterium]
MRNPSRGSLGVAIVVLALVLVLSLAMLTVALIRSERSEESGGGTEELTELLEEVELGMTTENVRTILGEPRDISTVGIPRNCPKAVAQGLKPGQVKAWTYWEGETPDDYFSVIMVRDEVFEILRP